VARRRAARIPAVREAAGLAAYRAGQWQTAIGELRAYHRMSGRQSHVAILADCERALGRPERAVDMFRTVDRDQLSTEEAIELLIVAAGARADLGQRDAAVAMLQVRELSSEEPWVARLRYAYADALLAVGRGEEAREWFARAAEVDEDAATDAAERLLELDGVVFADHGDEIEEDDELDVGVDEDDELDVGVDEDDELDVGVDEDEDGFDEGVDEDDGFDEPVDEEDGFDEGVDEDRWEGQDKDTLKDEGTTDQIGKTRAELGNGAGDTSKEGSVGTARSSAVDEPGPGTP
jgi:tetratricopeptide (TPR) repeat protein